MSSNVSVGLARLLAIIKALNINTLRCQHIAFMALQLKEQSQRQHREILDACHAGDVEGGIRALESHLSESSQYFVSYVRQIDKGAQVQNSPVESSH